MDPPLNISVLWLAYNERGVTDSMAPLKLIKAAKALDQPAVRFLFELRTALMGLSPEAVTATRNVGVHQNWPGDKPQRCLADCLPRCRRLLS